MWRSLRAALRGMPKIPETHHTTVHFIENAYAARHQQDHRPHLGASVLGHYCDRHIQFKFRWVLAENISPRILRLFARGEREEAVFVQLLRHAHVLVWDRDADGKQFGFRDGHLGGSADGICARLPEAMHTVHLLECKTHNDKSFKQLVKAGSIQESHPQHYAQCVLYMYKLDLKAALYLAVNKNDDTLYAERVKADTPHAKALVEKGHTLSLESRLVPPISTDPSWYQCKMCSFYPVCHQGADVETNCRTCEQVEPRRDGTWWCHLYEKALSVDEQRRGCESHVPFIQEDR